MSRKVEAIYNLNLLKCRSDGNPLNSSIAPVPPPTSPLALSPPSTSPPSPYAFWGPPSGRTPPGTPPTSEQEKSNSGKAKSFFTTKRVVGISIGGVFVLIILVLVVLFLMPRGTKRRGASDRISKLHQIGAYRDRENPPMDNESRVQPNNQLQKGKQLVSHFFFVNLIYDYAVFSRIINMHFGNVTS